MRAEPQPGPGQGFLWKKERIQAAVDRYRAAYIAKAVQERAGPSADPAFEVHKHREYVVFRDEAGAAIERRHARFLQGNGD